MLFSCSGDNRRVQYRTTTVGSAKWTAGHRAGCVFYAPDNACICDKIKAKYDAKYPPSEPKVKR